MTSHTVEGQLGRPVTVDLCAQCQAIWFDPRESLQLTPGATLNLFRIIGEHVAKPHALESETAKCPRCNARLRRTQDLQRSTRFEYYRCPHDHGRLTTFFDFLKEKDFIRPLTPLQIAELRKNIQIVNCSNCGAPIDLAGRTDCGHCGSPLSMLDMQQAEKLVAQLREADRTDKPVDPALPLALARARREAEAAWEGLPRDSVWSEQSLDLGLVGAGLSALARLLRNL
jgi:Zn-finger nucleic acid-binding protein